MNKAVSPRTASLGCISHLSDGCILAPLSNHSTQKPQSTHANIAPSQPEFWRSDGLRMTINSAVAFSLGLLFLALVGCAVVFLAGLVRLMREGRQGAGPTWIAASLGVALLVIAATPLARPAVSVLARWAAAGRATPITAAKYGAIRSGMRYEEVKQLLGGEG